MARPRLDVPEADRADELVADMGDQRQPLRRRTALAQPLAGFGEAGRTEGDVEQALAGAHIRHTFFADDERQIGGVTEIIHADIGHRGLLMGHAATLAPSTRSRARRPSGIRFRVKSPAFARGLRGEPAQIT